MFMDQTNSVPTIFIISGGVGASAEQVVHTLLAQFPEEAVRVTTVGNVRHPEQITEALSQARKLDALVVYTLVDPSLHDYLLHESQKRQIRPVDLMGPIMEWVTEKLGMAPKGQGGLYRQLHSDYFERVAAIDFTLDHNDGKDPDGWPQADVVLVGASRVGKTPLSFYLAVHGLKVANVPLVSELPVPESLFALDPQRVFGLTVEPAQLLEYRSRRQKLLGAPGPSRYADPQAIYEEVEETLKVFRKGRFKVIDMTDKTIEQAADEIIRHLSASQQLL
jgi:[pyruvate, water dikinase]-phosphate phosphotransferase / [pyruvate, water dikinase] kinase